MKKIEKLATNLIPNEEIHKLATEITLFLFDNKYLNYTSFIDKNEFIHIISYFLLYGYLPLHLPNNYSDNERFEIVLITLVSTPWLGADLHRYESALKQLIEIDFLIFDVYYDKLVHYIAMDFNSIILSNSKILSLELQNYLLKNFKNYDERLKIHDDLGWTIEAKDVKEEILNILNKFDNNLTLSLIVYHGRNWFGTDRSGGFIQDLLSKYKNLNVRILMVDYNAHNIIRECYTKEEAINASNSGIISISNLVRCHRDRIDIRYYGKKEDMGYLRGIFIEDIEKNIIMARITNWRFGYERPIYGKAIKLNKDSSLVKICVQYYNYIYNNARPVGNFRRKAKFYIRKNSVKVFIISSPMIILWIILLTTKDIEMFTSTIISIIITIWGLVVPIVINLNH